MDYILHGFGVFLGVIAGTVVTVLAQWWATRGNELQKVKNLRFECQLNITKIDAWLEELEKYRNAVNGDSVAIYFGYFDFSRAVHVTADEMFQAGLLYKYLDHEEILKLQVIFTELSMNGEHLINQQIASNKANPDKQTAVSQINFYEDKLKGHRATFDSLRNKLKA